MNETRVKKKVVKSASQLEIQYRVEKYQIEKRKCVCCKAKYNGTRYQRWCVPCRNRLSSNYYYDQGDYE